MNLSKLETVLTHVTVNPEKAGGDEKGETGSSLKFEGDVPIDQLVGLGDYISSLAEFLYGKDKDDKPGYELVAKDVTSIEMKLRLEKVQASIGGVVNSDERIRFSGCRLNEITLVPKHGRAVGLTLKLYVHPENEGWNDLIALVKQGVTLSVWGGSRIEDKKPAQANLQLGAPAPADGGTTSVAPAGPVADAAAGTH